MDTMPADSAIAAQDFNMAAEHLQEFAKRRPVHVPTLLKLVEVCVDGGLEAAMYQAQVQLTDAYLETGHAVEARVIAEDLVAREPWERVHIERFRHAWLAQRRRSDALIAERHRPGTVHGERAVRRSPPTSPRSRPRKLPRHARSGSRMAPAAVITDDDDEPVFPVVPPAEAPVAMWSQRGRDAGAALMGRSTYQRGDPASVTDRRDRDPEAAFQNIRAGG